MHSGDRAKACDIEGKARRKGSLGLSILCVLLAVFIWGGLVYGGFYIARQYIDRSIQKVQQTNAMNVKALEDRLETMSGEMREIEKRLGMAGQTLSSSDSTQKELNVKIQKLDVQLQELERSLKILKEAPNAAR